MISMGFKNSDRISILVKGDVPLICTFRYRVLVNMYFSYLFSKIIWMRHIESGSGVLYLKKFLGVVGV